MIYIYFFYSSEKKKKKVKEVNFVTAEITAILHLEFIFVDLQLLPCFFLAFPLVQS